MRKLCRCEIYIIPFPVRGHVPWWPPVYDSLPCMGEKSRFFFTSAFFACSSEMFSFFMSLPISVSCLGNFVPVFCLLIHSLQAAFCIVLFIPCNPFIVRFHRHIWVSGAFVVVLGLHGWRSSVLIYWQRRRGDCACWR